MLVVDPVKRITIPEITQHPFYTADLPRYLTPLPNPGPVTLSSLVTPPKALDYEIIEGLGRIEEDVVDELAFRMVGIEKDDIWECLRRDDGVQGNAVKVAYMLLRDKRRLGKDCKSHRTRRSARSNLNWTVAQFAEQERDAQLAAMDVRLDYFQFSQPFVDASYSRGMLSPPPPYPREEVILKKTLLMLNSMLNTRTERM
jgi:carbon catabolite-derepressing protein kinase